MLRRFQFKVLHALLLLLFQIILSRTEHMLRVLITLIDFSSRVSLKRFLSKLIGEAMGQIKSKVFEINGRAL